ncbi:hypothetical protein BGZ98_009287 [Dissophora globulifera]|nr:hypothetical protein BGZ98_009287 [Dissophora globulifera]
MATTHATPPPAEPYNVWADNATPPLSLKGDDQDLDMEELIRIEEAVGGAPSAVNGGRGGSPTKYSIQTIRQKKGRKLVSSMKPSSSATLASAFDVIQAEEHETGHGHRLDESVGDIDKRKTTITTETTRNSTGGIAHPTVVAPTRSFRGGFPSVGLYQGLGRLQAISAMAFGTFGFIHLVPPMLASVGGINLANKALLWGRVYYQTNGVEQVLVYGSLAVHLGSGLLRALVRCIWKATAYFRSKNQGASDTGSSTSTTTTTTTTTTTSTGSSSKSSTSTSSSSSSSAPSGLETSRNTGGNASAPGLFPFHRLVGWLLTPIVLGHMDTMRVIPVEVLGDSSMIDYGFVTFLHRVKRPAPYILLVGLMAYHMFGGGPVAYNMVLPKGSERRIKVQELTKSKKTRAIIAGLVSTVALVGAYRIMTSDVVIPMSKIYLTLLD